MLRSIAVDQLSDGMPGFCIVAAVGVGRVRSRQGTRVQMSRAASDGCGTTEAPLLAGAWGIVLHLPEAVVRPNA